jgi:ABC-2 type transport system permease protein
MKTLRLWTAFLRIELLLIRRNPLEMVGLGTLTAVVVLTLFFGIRILVPSVASSSQNQGAVMSALLVLAVATNGYQSISNAVYLYASNGTLEQLAMSPFGLWRVLVANFTVVLLQSIAYALPVMVIAGVASREPLRPDLLTLVPLFLLLLAGLLGIALLLGGATLVYKRMQFLSGIIVLPILALVSLPVDRLWFLKVLPIALPNALIRDVWVQHQGLLQLPHTDLAIAITTSVVYAAGGVWLFRLMDRRAREKGVLGQY